MGCIPYFGAFLPYFDGLSAGLKPGDPGRNLLLPPFSGRIRFALLIGLLHRAIPLNLVWSFFVEISSFLLFDANIAS
jgi:hypothetical protein